MEGTDRVVLKSSFISHVENEWGSSGSVFVPVWYHSKEQRFNCLGWVALVELWPSLWHWGWAQAHLNLAKLAPDYGIYLFIKWNKKYNCKGKIRTGCSFLFVEVTNVVGVYIGDNCMSTTFWLSGWKRCVWMFTTCNDKKWTRYASSSSGRLFLYKLKLLCYLIVFEHWLCVWSYMSVLDLGRSLTFY